MPATNDGYKVYTILVEYSNLTNLPTGRQKPNIPSDPNYIAPILDLISCPIVAPQNMNIIVEIAAGFTADIGLRYGASILTRSTPGTWTVPRRTYDAVTFSVTVEPSPYICKVTYNNGLVMFTLAPGMVRVLLRGPFIAISKIEILAADGDFNNDFNNDFN
jgi:hypothetical protein